MKKIFSLILICTLMLSVSIIPTFAQTNEIDSQLREVPSEKVDDITAQYPYIERFFAAYQDTEEAYYADELFYYEIGEMDVDCDDAIDFAVIFSHYAMAPDALDGGVIGNRFIIQPQLYAPFRFGYALYDIENNEFIPFSENILNDYPFVEEFMEKHRIGAPFGDADNDRVLTIMDATYIQRVLAELEEFKPYDDISYYSTPLLTYRSDFNRDGQRDVLDATGIQFAIAKLDTELETDK